MADSWADEYLRMIDDCEKRESRLSEWEQDFVQSIRERLEVENPRPLSEKQTNTLDRIWEKATARG